MELNKIQKIDASIVRSFKRAIIILIPFSLSIVGFLIWMVVGLDSETIFTWWVFIMWILALAVCIYGFFALINYYRHMIAFRYIISDSYIEIYYDGNINRDRCTLEFKKIRYIRVFPSYSLVSFKKADLYLENESIFQLSYAFRRKKNFFGGNVDFAPFGFHKLNAVIPCINKEDARNLIEMIRAKNSLVKVEDKYLFSSNGKSVLD